MLKKDWGSEVIWGQTDNYIVKTIELAPNKQTPIYLHTQREKNFVIVSGDLYFLYGDCCGEEPLKTYKLPVGWSWYIEPKKFYQYKTLDEPARLIEVSSYEEDVDEYIFEEADMDSEVVKKRLGEKI